MTARHIDPEIAAASNTKQKALQKLALITENSVFIGDASV